MTKMLVCKIRMPDGTEETVKTYADDHERPRRVLRDILPRGAKIISHEWLDTLTERRIKWNLENPECQIPLDL